MRGRERGEQWGGRTFCTLCAKRRGMLVGGWVLFAASCGHDKDRDSPGEPERSDESRPAGGTGGSTGTGGKWTDPNDCHPGFNGRGSSSSGEWDGYFFTESTEASVIVPPDFFGSCLCASGVVGPSFEEWAGVGWNIAEELHPETFEGVEIQSVPPGGTGLQVKVVNNAGTHLTALLRTDDFGSKRFCAPIPESGEAIIPWGDFTMQGCGAMSGPEGVGGAGPEVYDP